MLLVEELQHRADSELASRPRAATRRAPGHVSQVLQDFYHSQQQLAQRMRIDHDMDAFDEWQEERLRASVGL